MPTPHCLLPTCAAGPRLAPYGDRFCVCLCREAIAQAIPVPHVPCCRAARQAMSGRDRCLRCARSLRPRRSCCRAELHAVSSRDRCLRRARSLRPRSECPDGGPPPNSVFFFLCAAVCATPSVRRRLCAGRPLAHRCAPASGYVRPSRWPTRWPKRWSRRPGGCRLLRRLPPSVGVVAATVGGRRLRRRVRHPLQRLTPPNAASAGATYSCGG